MISIKVPLVPNLDTNLPNMRTQLAKMEAGQVQLGTAIEELRAGIAKRERDSAEALRRINEVRASAGKVTYPPYCNTKAAQQAYLKALRHDAMIAARRRT